MEKDIIIKKLPFYKSLNKEEIQYVIDNSKIVKKEKGSMIFNCKHGCSGMIFVLSGEIRTYMISEEGREITLFKLKPGELCVLSASCVLSQITFETEMSIEQDSILLMLSSSAFSKLVENNIYVKCYCYELLSNRFSQVMFAMQQILFMGFDKRLAMFLLKEMEINNSNIIMLTHSEIAKNTNTAREVVARMLKRFELDNILSYKRGEIEILDKEKLIKMRSNVT